ncbi:TonB-dependent receptor plug domain-containing protein [Flavobacterium humi]|uniref:TonB-dependent receptor plug domain-containing protein n=1 Tax=Flavobacterium humi TaxID=2562683 RepID=A0A4Z0L9X0_9FLAO|nr:TonB-dependent receptor plug domain-containing protein [Flavobacterium humi]TGD59109.1 hypothetical protein E4635_04460 [Flavobacterium humi]
MKSARRMVLALTVLLSSMAFGQQKDSIGNKKHFAYRCVQSISNNPGKSSLFIVNGFETTEDIMMRLDTNTIESVNVIKGIEATAIYGVKGSNGAIIITLKDIPRKDLRKLKKDSDAALARQRAKDSLITRQ